MTSVAPFKPRDAPPPPTSLNRAIVRDLLIVAAVGAVIWIGHRLGRIVVVLILALFLAYLIAPLVELAQSPVVLKGRSRRLPRGVAIAVVYLLLAAGITAGAAVLWPSAAQQLDEAIASAPQYTESFRLWERGWTRYYERLRIPLELRHSIDQSVVGAGDAGLAYARGSLLAAIGALSDIPWLILVPVLAFLLLKDAAGIRRTLLTALPHGIQLRGHRLFEELNLTLAAYVRAQLIACVLVGSARAASASPCSAFPMPSCSVALPACWSSFPSSDRSSSQPSLSGWPPSTIRCSPYGPRSSWQHCASRRTMRSIRA